MARLLVAILLLFPAAVFPADTASTDPQGVPSSAPEKLTISGTVSGDFVTDKGAKKVTITVKRQDGNGASTKKSPEPTGDFRFDDLPAGKYLVTPRSDDYVFSPPSFNDWVSADTSVDFDSKTSHGATRRITGTMSGAVSSDVAIDVTGTNATRVLTGSNGEYELAGLANGTYTLTPSAKGLSFTPSSASVQIKDADAVQDFVAVATQCAPPTASFKWVGTGGSYLRTNAKFMPTRASARSPAASSTPAPTTGRCSAKPVSPSIRILNRRGECLDEIRDLATFRHCGIDDGADCTEQVFPVVFGDKVNLVENGFRVSVEFTGLQNCSGQVRIEDVIVIPQHRLSVDIGASWALKGDGSFEPHLEAALNANSRWTSWLYGDVDLRLATLEPTSSGTISISNGSKQTFDAAGRALFSPEAIAGGQNYQPWWTPVAGVGARSKAPTELTELRFRAFGGIRLQVNGFNAGEPAENFGNSRGFIEFGYAWDTFWQPAPQRGYAEGQLEIPSFGSKWVRLLMRLKIDKPIGTGGGPSEVRVSVLSSINPTILGEVLGFGPRR
jgi:hypothetical protein